MQYYGLFCQLRYDLEAIVRAIAIITMYGLFCQLLGIQTSVRHIKRSNRSIAYSNFSLFNALIFSYFSNYNNYWQQHG